MALSQTRLNDITILRVVSMLMIVLCHIISFYTFIPGSQILGKIFDVGVFTFFLISGYLYGTKERKPFKNFILKRVVHILIPVLSVIIIDLVVLYFFFSESYSIETVFCYIFNLQGLAFISWDLFDRFFVQISNLGPLWFASVILLCYCMLPSLHHIRNKITKPIQWGIFWMAILLSAVLQYAVNIDLFFFVTFYLGFLLSNTDYREKKIPFSRLLPFSLFLILMQVLRLYLQSVVDGGTFYFTFVSLSHIALGLLFFIFFVELNKIIPRTFDNIANSGLVRSLDKASLHIYLVHGIFCFGATNIYDAISNIWVATLVYFVLVAISTVFLYFLDKFISKPINALMFKKS